MDGPADDLNDAALAAMFSATKKKKKKAPKPEDADAADAVSMVGDLAPDTEPDLSYDQMLEKIYELMGIERDESTASVRIKPPKVERIGSKKTAWLNFRSSCETLKRSEDHMSLFFSAEIGSLTSITQDGALLIRGVLPNTKIESLVRKYIENYVKCPMCRSTNTTLHKDADTRLMTLQCNFCKASRTSAPITVGFHATMKGERKKNADRE
jgi:translation initiation factor 2 subunit 2